MKKDIEKVLLNDKQKILELIVQDEELLTLLLKHLLLKKCVDIGISYPGSIYEFLYQLSSKAVND